ncbi:MAG: hypothetical protein JWN77_905 [Frankiales bacterium]|jgi:hypothetical protein|nr:hypothetical protein [Frankiales bacterium]
MTYADVPEVPRDAEVDPHWQELRGLGWGLPEAYMPPAMAGHRSGWMRIAAWVLITVFLTATTGGICLTYGPGN